MKINVKRVIDSTCIVEREFDNMVDFLKFYDELKEKGYSTKIELSKNHWRMDAPGWTGHLWIHVMPYAS